MSEKTLTALTWVVAGIWATNVVVGMIGLGGYKSSEGINAIFTLTIGAAFAYRAKSRNGDGDGDS